MITRNEAKECARLTDIMFWENTIVDVAYHSVCVFGCVRCDV